MDHLHSFPRRLEATEKRLRGLFEWAGVMNLHILLDYRANFHIIDLKNLNLALRGAANLPKNLSWAGSDPGSSCNARSTVRKTTEIISGTSPRRHAALQKPQR